ncbi:MAG TPA: c-type cytochrome [Rectinemataceae bacterium]|nr:c-type cytochrome [Rectinemataceae bacterium]
MVDSFYALLKLVGFDEPLHAPITHLPIGLTVGAFIFLIVAIVFKKKQLLPTARHAAILAFVFVFPTILLGVLDWMHFYRAVLMPAIVIKITLASIVLVSLGAVVILGGEAKLHSFWMTSLLAIAFVGVMGLGYFGSGILYGRAITVEPAVGGKTTAANAVPQSPEFRRGRAVFAANCQSCHGNGLNAIVASLPLKTSTKLASLDSLKAFVRSPHMPDGSAGQMPTFDPSILSDAQVSDLYAYVSKAWK